MIPNKILFASKINEGFPDDFWIFEISPTLNKKYYVMYNTTTLLMQIYSI